MDRRETLKIIYFFHQLLFEKKKMECIVKKEEMEKWRDSTGF